MRDTVRIRVTVEREFEMDARRCLAERDFDPPSADATNEEKREWLNESFWELCGYDREHDHIDGRYVWSVDADDVADFEWPEWLRAD